ncbi:MAG TPA: N-acetylmuramoyl-L-alanine amidase [Gaiellaceae bacterium]|nr:N-acetylmuramoyl-L-alanine amidase [Gaiellaceae bacterium]
MRLRLLIAVLAAAVLAGPAQAAMPKRPPLVWLRGEGNYTKAHRPPTGIRVIVIHATEGPFWPSVRWLRNEHAHASSHFIVSRRGRIIQLVHTSDIAWHAGNMAVNRVSLGIEHVGQVDDPAGFTDREYKASARLVAYYARAALMPVDRTHIIGHSEVPDPFDPTQFGGADHHTDPGAYWNWDKYMRLVRKFAYPPRPVHITVRAPNLRNGQLVKGTFRWRARTTGPVRKVEVVIDGKVRLRDLRAPFGGLWETRRLENGRHTVELRAHGPRGHRAVVRFRVVVRNAPLVVRASAPKEVAGLLRLRARISGGKPRRILLYVDGKRVDHDTSQPFVFSWNSARVPNGRHVLELRATSRDGRIATTRLTVTVVNPAIASQAVTNGVWNVQTRGRVERVEFVVDGQLVGSAAAAPFAWQLGELPPGEHALTARVFGPNGSVVEATIPLTV